MTTEQLDNIIKLKNSEKICKAFNDTCEKFEINTPLRQCHFLTQMLHESSGFTFYKEIASGQAYEFRKDLGNTLPGQGKRYKGRGFIQITGFYNYKKASEYFKVDFLKNPEYLEQLPYAMLVSGWFWNDKNLNPIADTDNVLLISKRINGVNKATGLPNHFEQRKLWLQKCKKAIIV